MFQNVAREKAMVRNKVGELIVLHKARSCNLDGNHATVVVTNSKNIWDCSQNNQQYWVNKEKRK